MVRRLQSAGLMIAGLAATRGDMSYEFDRQNGNLTYASSTTKEGSATGDDPKASRDRMALILPS